MNVYMFVGIAASGKSTEREKLIKELDNPHVYSSDDRLMSYCKYHGITYNEGFRDYYKIAIAAENGDLITAIRNGRDVIWDQTNLTKKSRAAKMRKFTGDYKFHAIVINPPSDEELDRRNALRAGKEIPQSVLETMKQHFKDNPVTKDEGFETIRFVDTEEKTDDRDVG